MQLLSLLVFTPTWAGAESRLQFPTWFTFLNNVQYSLAPFAQHMFIESYCVPGTDGGYSGEDRCRCSLYGAYILTGSSMLSFIIFLK